MTNYSGMEMRKAYAKTIEELYAEDKNIFALEADLSASMSTASLKSIMGENYLNLGIMEANMISVAAGINLAGGYCYIHSFGQFLARRAMDQIFISMAYAGLKGCLVGSDSGVTAEHNGGTHMTFEDMGIIRTIPGVEIYDVCDPVELSQILKEVKNKDVLTYIRTARKKAVRDIYTENENFSKTGAKILREGKDITILACGIEVNEALKAAEELSEKGIEAEVVDCYRIKPLDEEVILKSVSKTKKVLTCENHNVNNGLGSAVAELLGEKMPTKMYRIGVREQFGQVGKLDYLMQQYKLTDKYIVEAVEKL